MNFKELALLVLFTGCCLATSAQSIPIQLMVVDQNGFEKTNTTVKLRLTLSSDTVSSTGRFQEVHSIVTNDLGVVSVNLGDGIVTTNSNVLDLSSYTFTDTEPFIKVEIDTTISPTNYHHVGWIKYSYPLVARRALLSDSANYLKNVDSDWFKDSSEFNEIQALSFNDSSAILSISEGNSVLIEKAAWFKDSSESNEIQRLSFNDTTGELTITKGNSVLIQTPVNSTEKSEVLNSLAHNSLTYMYWREVYNDTLWGKGYNGELLKAPLSDPHLVDTLNLSFTVEAVHPSDSVILSRNGWTSFVIRGLDGTIKATQNVSGISSSYAYITEIVFKPGKVAFYVRTGYSTGRYYSWNYELNLISSIESNTLGSHSSSNTTVTAFSNNPVIIYDRFTLTPIYSQSYNSSYDRIRYSSYNSSSGCGIKATGYGGFNSYSGFRSNGQTYIGSVDLGTNNPAFESGGMVFFTWNNGSRSGIGYIDLDNTQSVSYEPICGDYQYEIGASSSTIQFIRGENEREVYLIIYQAINFPINGQKYTGDLILKVDGNS